MLQSNTSFMCYVIGVPSWWLKYNYLATPLYGTVQLVKSSRFTYEQFVK